MSHQYNQQPQQGQPSHQYNQQPQQGQPSHQYNQQPQQGQPGHQPTRTSGHHGMRGGQQMGGHQTGGQQMGAGTQPQAMQGQQSGTQPAPSFEDHLTDELRLLLEDFSELSHVTAWCAKECATGAPALGTCARICQDLAEIAELNEMLIARDSMFGPEVADMFIRVANEGLPELYQHQQQHPHITETIAAIERTMNSCESVLQQLGGQQPTTGGQQAGPQGMGGQQMGGQPTQPMPEQGQHGHEMSGQPTGGAGSMGRQY
ncbi:hypothetical protein [Natrinema salaciae]|uniref:Uncharacterized protein n=1 Tax=Natrinema salaciae TaxID=1186196 RepID=A0A1H9IPA2_9EURY|nr:hypothetical protein [Natrinema salaciae]SEQ76420.1 hypothetical protein SAMN04489841_2293 [Natrinema salaciae]